MRAIFLSSVVSRHTMSAGSPAPAPPPPATPAWRSGMAVGEWRELTSTALSSVAPTPTPAGTTGPSSKVIAWTSFALDPRNDKLYSAANGGHLDYSGNEVDVIDLSVDAPAWSEAIAPTAAGSVVQNVDYYSDGRPSARHTYYGVVVCEQNDELLVFGGNVYGSAGNLTADVAALDLTTLAWKADGTRPNMVAGSTALQAHPTVVDPSTGDVYVLSNEMVQRWTRASNTWSERVAQFAGPYGFEAMSAMDTTRGRILVIGGLADAVRLYTLSGDAMSTPTLTGLGGSISAQDGGAMVYSAAADAYFVRLGGAGGTIYRIDPATFNVTDFTTTGGASVPATTNGPYNKFCYSPTLGGCVYVPSYTGNVWFLRTE